MAISKTSWQKGYCPNPGGRPKNLSAVRDKALSYCEDGLEILARMMKDEGENPQVRLAAIKMILDRGLGLPKVTEDGDDKKVVTPRTANDEELRERIAYFENRLDILKDINVIEMKGND